LSARRRTRGTYNSAPARGKLARPEAKGFFLAMTSSYLANVHILVVEDNPFARRMMVEVLKYLGAIGIAYAKDGEEAWQAIARDMPDLVLLDWDMHPVSGLEFLRRVRHDPKSPNPYLPVVMVTGFADRAHVFGAREAGVNEYIVKPLSAKALLDRIQAVIERPRRYVRIGKYFGPDRRRKDKQFVGFDKRGLEQKPARPAIPATADMRQDEINALFNPDDVPPAAPIKGKKDKDRA
jgi:two-component system, chemotaxis family, chemotaxis protein CheY